MNDKQIQPTGEAVMSGDDLDELCPGLNWRYRIMVTSENFHDWHVCIWQRGGQTTHEGPFRTISDARSAMTVLAGRLMVQLMVVGTAAMWQNDVDVLFLGYPHYLA